MLDTPPLKPLDRVLQRWRFRKAQPFIGWHDRILDVGCSDGALFRYLGDRFGFGVGVDPALRSSIDADRYLLLADTFPGALSESETFHVITMLAVLEHIPADRLEELRRECVRLLKPGGRLVITVPSKAVDGILYWLSKMRLVEGIGLHEHHGFEPAATRLIFSDPQLHLMKHRKFQLGLNNLFVFEKRL